MTAAPTVKAPVVPPLPASRKRLQNCLPAEPTKTSTAMDQRLGRIDRRCRTPTPARPRRARARSRGHRPPARTRACPRRPAAARRHRSRDSRLSCRRRGDSTITCSPDATNSHSPCTSGGAVSGPVRSVHDRPRPSTASSACSSPLAATTRRSSEAAIGPSTSSGVCQTSRRRRAGARTRPDCSARNKRSAEEPGGATGAPTPRSSRSAEVGNAWAPARRLGRAGAPAAIDARKESGKDRCGASASHTL